MDRIAFEEFKILKSPYYVLVSSLDGISHLRRDLSSLLAPEDQGRRLFVEKKDQAAGTLADLPNHAILDRGRLIGLWEFDTETSSIVWFTFDKKDKALTAAVKRTEAFVRDQLGDARSFSLDTPKSRGPRIEALRKAAG